MPLAFVSHSTKDAAFVAGELVPFLERNGIGAWHSGEAIRSADEWESKIRAGLQACDWFLVVLTGHAVASDWVRTEVHWAIDHRPGRIIPLLLDGCNAGDLHLKLPRIQHVDFRSDRARAWRRLAETLFQAAPGADPTPPPGTLPTAAADESEPFVIDRGGHRTPLTAITTKEIEFAADDLVLTVPAASVREIIAVEPGGPHELRTIDGQVFAGECKSKLEGEWFLGTCAVEAADIKHASFGNPPGPLPQAEQADGFVVVLRTRGGASVELAGVTCRKPTNYYERNRTFLPVDYDGALIGLPFADISSIRYGEPVGGAIRLEIALVGGRRLAANRLRDNAIMAERLAGSAAVGTVSVDLDRIAEATFDHAKSKNAKRTNLIDEMDTSDPVLDRHLAARGRHDSPYRFDVRTRNGKSFTLSSACLCSCSIMPDWHRKRTSLDVMIGQASHTVGLERITRIRFGPPEDRTQRLTIEAAGHSIDASRETWSVAMIGNLEGLGIAAILLNEVETLEITREG